MRRFAVIRIAGVIAMLGIVAGCQGLVYGYSDELRSAIRVDVGEREQIEHGAPVEAQSFESRLKHVLARAGMSSRQTRWPL